MRRKPTKDIPAQSYLHECFSYDPHSGELRWRERPRSHFPKAYAWKAWNTRYAGMLAGALSGSGHIIVYLDYAVYLAHRLIWRIMTGADPHPALVDHANGNGDDNRWVNLRIATVSQNQQNKRAGYHNRSGLKCVRACPSGRFGAYIWLPEGKSMWLGTFDTSEAAHAAYCEKARELHGEFFNPGSR